MSKPKDELEKNLVEIIVTFDKTTAEFIFEALKLKGKKCSGCDSVMTPSNLAYATKDNIFCNNFEHVFKMSDDLEIHRLKALEDKPKGKD